MPVNLDEIPQGWTVSRREKAKEYIFSEINCLICRSLIQITREYNNVLRPISPSPPNDDYENFEYRMKMQNWQLEHKAELDAELNPENFPLALQLFREIIKEF